MRALVDSVLAFTAAHAQVIPALRHRARQAAMHRGQWPVLWRIDTSRSTPTRFKGFTAVYSASKLGNYTRLSYDRKQPWEREIACFERCVEELVVDAPRAYLVPRAWQSVIARLQWNGVRLRRLQSDRPLQVRAYRILSVVSRPQPYEGRSFHDTVEVAPERITYDAQAGDCLVDLDQPHARYAVETLEPQAHDSFFRWGFFNSVLEKKERYSDYVFEDTALEMLQDEPELQARFEQWKGAHPELLANQSAVLDFLFGAGRRHHEPGWMRYPVMGLMDQSALP